jgi:predicted amidohydrolase
MRAIAVAQTVPARGNIEANIQQHLRLAEVAAGWQAQVLVFPELSLTGYELDLADASAFSAADPRLAPLVEACAAQAMTVVAGAPVRLDTRLHAGAFIIGPDGSVGLYTKHHLGAFQDSAGHDGVVPPAERTVFEPGSLNPLVRFGGNTAAVAVCADAGRPSHPRQAARRGARTYLASMFVIPSEFAAETANLEASAVQYSMAVAFANYGGPTGGLAAAGGSTIWSENGDLLARLESTGSGVAFAMEDGAGWRASTVMLSDA